MLSSQYTWNENMTDIREKYQENNKKITYPDVVDKVDKVLDVCWTTLKNKLQGETLEINTKSGKI